MKQRLEQIKENALTVQSVSEYCKNPWPKDHYGVEDPAWEEDLTTVCHDHIANCSPEVVAAMCEYVLAREEIAKTHIASHRENIRSARARIKLTKLLKGTR